MEYVLTQEILALSYSQSWDQAVKEWSLYEIIHLNKDDDEGETCLCGHSPIFELCYIENSINKNHALVGNCCIKKFDKMEQIKKALTSAKTRKVNSALIEFSYSKHIISDWEYHFMMDTWRKRVLSEKQNAVYNRIVTKIFKNIIKTDIGR